MPVAVVAGFRASVTVMTASPECAEDDDRARGEDHEGNTEKPCNARAIAGMVFAVEQLSDEGHSEADKAE